MRIVVSNHEVPHLWAHRTQSEAKNANGSFYFNGDTIYSYGSHFPIARHVTQPDGMQVVFVTTRTYSVTTSGHVGRVRNAIPSSVTEWFVARPDHSPEGCFEEFRAVCKRLMEEVADAKNKVSKAKRYLQYEEKAEYANAFASTFKLKGRITIAPSGDVVAAIATERKQEADRQRRARAKQARELVKRDAARRLEMADVAAKWQAGEYVNGREYYYPDALLRIEGDELVTSMGARIPLSHALRGLRFVEAVRASGKAYQRNGHTIHLGHYAIDSIDVLGNLKAGCHYIQWAEIERIAPLLRASGVTENSTTEEAGNVQ